jgi:peptide/nickel transport system substrate-binding protein
MSVQVTRRSVLAGAAATATLGTTLGTIGPVAAHAADGALRIAVPTYPDHLDPVMRAITPLYRTVHNCFESLLRMDLDTGALKPGLATSWQRTSPTTVAVTLRDNVRFHDGTIMTAEDVAFSLGPTHLLGPGGQGVTAAKDFLDTFASVEVTGPLAVKVTTKAPDPLVLQRLGAWTSQIVSRKAFDAAGSWEKWGQAPIGTGPYAIAEVKTDSRLQLKSHKDYWGGRPPYDALEYRVVPESSSRLNALLANDVDIAVDMLPDQIAAMEKSGTLDVVGGPISAIRLLAMDTTGPVLKDPRIRQALSLAIDRKVISDTLWAGRVSVPNGLQYPAFGDTYIEDFPAPRYDPDMAMRLIKEAGYSGTPIEYRSFTSYYTNEVPTAQVLLEMWRAVGLNVNLTIVENFQQLLRKPINAIFNTSQTMQFPDPVGLMWRSYGASGQYQRLHGIWKNDEYNRLGKVLIESLEPEQRRAAHKRMLEISALEDPPVVILHSNAVFYGRRKGVQWQPGTTLNMYFGPART